MNNNLRNLTTVQCAIFFFFCLQIAMCENAKRFNYEQHTIQHFWFPLIFNPLTFKSSWVLMRLNLFCSLVICVFVIFFSNTTEELSVRFVSLYAKICNGFFFVLFLFVSIYFTFCAVSSTLRMHYQKWCGMVC